ncbi:30S ribosomal protein S16 [Fulvivirga sp.]|uniref:30S ribosomal protein S16 n=1 Tax=Fulvivirga sp. TaxID=1931237 RepID=UPI0032EB176C
MSVKIRLTRRGRKSQAIYDVVVADARSPRDGKFIEKIGRYNPNVNPAFIELDEGKAFDWVMKGAQPTDTVRAMLSYRGVMYKKHLQVGVNKGAITQEEADKKFAAWQDEKLAKVEAKKDNLAKDTASKAKARKEAEEKVKEARAESLRKKAEELNASAEEAEAPAAEATEEAAETAEVEAPAAEAPVETPEAAAEETPEASAEEEKKEE